MPRGAAPWGYPKAPQAHDRYRPRFSQASPGGLSAKPFGQSTVGFGAKLSLKFFGKRRGKFAGKFTGKFIGKRSAKFALKFIGKRRGKFAAFLSGRIFNQPLSVPSDFSRGRLHAYPAWPLNPPQEPKTECFSVSSMKKGDRLKEKSLRGWSLANR
jgi:hypothetical protein